MKKLVEKFFFMIQHYFWNRDSPVRRFSRKHPVLFAVLGPTFGLPSLALSILLFLVLMPIGFAYYKLAGALRLVRSLVVAGRWRRTLSAAGIMVLQIPLFCALLGAGYVGFSILLFALHWDHAGGFSGHIRTAMSFFICVYGTLLLFLMATQKWGKDQPSRDLDLEEEREKEIKALEAPGDPEMPPLFNDPDYRKLELKIASVSPLGRLCLLNFLLSASILLSALVCHEMYFFFGKQLFEGVTNEGHFGQWLLLILDIFIGILPIEILDIFNIKLTSIKASSPYGSLLLIILNAAIAWVLLSFFYGFVNRLLKKAEDANQTKTSGQERS